MNTPYDLNHWLWADLAVTAYPTKLHLAVEYADNLFDDEGTFEWYLAARERFLALGGKYIVSETLQ